MTRPQDTDAPDLAPLVPAEFADAQWQLYEQRKAEFRRANPCATSEQYEAAISRIVDELGL